MKKVFCLLLLVIIPLNSVFSLIWTTETADIKVVDADKKESFLKAYNENNTEEIYNLIITDNLPNLFYAESGEESVFELIMGLNDPKCINALTEYAINYVRNYQKQSLLRSETEQPIQIDLCFYFGMRKLNVPVYLKDSEESKNAKNNNQSFIEYECSNSILYFSPHEEKYELVSLTDGVASLVNYKNEIVDMVESTLNRDILKNTSLKLTYYISGYTFNFEAKGLPEKSYREIKNGNYVYKYFINFMDKSII